MSTRSRLRDNKYARETYLRSRAAVAAVRSTSLDHAAGLDQLPPEAVVRVLYQALLGRDPDPTGFETNVTQLRSGRAGWRDVAATLKSSSEFAGVGFSAGALLQSLHASRIQFIHSLPAARRIVDLGGTSLGQDAGALVVLGYPYEFDQLTIIDLPSDERHERYQSNRRPEQVPTDSGPVTYRYHSMTDLSSFDDGSVDLVYSGQSIEHVTREDGRTVVEEAYRILAPGGHLAIDTPNGRVTRMQQAEFIDPDHEVEYEWPELESLLTGAGFVIESAYGLNHGGGDARAGRFNPAEVARRWGLHHDLENCYLLAVVATKP